MAFVLGNEGNGVKDTTIDVCDGSIYIPISKAESLTTFEQLHKGDYVVHEKYGIGMYNGIVTRELNGLHKDYLQIRSFPLRDYML